MAQFSARERLIASLLSSMPGLKAVARNAYVRVGYLTHRKNYKWRPYNGVKEIHMVEPGPGGSETFFGYYDHSPENTAGDLLYCQTPMSTLRRPAPDVPVTLRVASAGGESWKVADSSSYNWQQGCRAQWTDSTQLAYNFYDSRRGTYCCALFDTSCHQTVRVYDRPLQDSTPEWFLSIDYRRVMRLRPDYGYRNNGVPDDAAMRDLKHDGIWRTDFATGRSELILSLEQIAGLQRAADPAHGRAPEPYGNALHKVNHVMIAPDGRSFIFIHRWYAGRRRYDRLMLYDFKTLRVLADENMVSHMCWTGPRTLFGYLRHNGRNAFWTIDTDTLEFGACPELDALDNGDGHPSYHDGRIVFDSYPDKSRMQHLWLYDLRTREVTHLLEVFQSVRHSGETRCDLHPRFSPDGRRVWFDTVYTGRRRLAWIDLPELSD